MQIDKSAPSVSVTYARNGSSTMAKESFDWIWCEHALTVGYRASLTEVVQIIGVPPAMRRER